MQNQSRQSTEKEITIRARAFSGQGVKTHRMLITDGTVKVYDPIAGYYTSCHSLSPASVKRIVRAN